MSLMDDLLLMGHQALRDCGGTAATWERSAASPRACTVTLAPALEDLMPDGAGLSRTRRLAASVGLDEIPDVLVDDVLRVATGPHAGLWTVVSIQERTGGATVCVVEWRELKKVGDPSALRRKGGA